MVNTRMLCVYGADLSAYICVQCVEQTFAGFYLGAAAAAVAAASMQAKEWRGCGRLLHVKSHTLTQPTARPSQVSQLRPPPLCIVSCAPPPFAMPVA